MSAFPKNFYNLFKIFSLFLFSGVKRETGNEKLVREDFLEINALFVFEVLGEPLSQREMEGGRTYVVANM